MNPTLALRAQGKKLWGTYPFAESAFLGGASSLRGLHEQRYAGDASLLGSAELRVDLKRVLFILPTDVGLFAFGDAGRVFLDGESSSSWTTGWGGGIWLAPLRRSSTVQVSLARAERRTAIYFGVGFAF
jgi:outer membrane translocation and assembly module TamA